MYIDNKEDLWEKTSFFFFVIQSLDIFLFYQNVKQTHFTDLPFICLSVIYFICL